MKVRTTIAALIVAALPLLAATGCHKPCPTDASVYYTAGC